MDCKTIHLYVNLPGRSPCFASVGEALDSISRDMPLEEEKRYPAPFLPIPPVVIHIGPGLYREKLVIKRPRVALLGEGARREDVVLLYGDAAYDPMPEGGLRGTFRTASVRVDASDFTAKRLTFQNDAGFGHTVGQALALYIDGDRCYLEDCAVLGSQDTLFTAPLPPAEAKPGGFLGPGQNRPRILGRHCFRNCFFQGDVDFLFGGAVCLFESCVLFSKKPGDRKPPESPPEDVVYGYVTAASTPQGRPFGYVFQNCKLQSDCPPGTVYLGRPWREYAKTVFLHCQMDAHIKRAGWDDWGKPHGHFFYGEYASFGPGACPEGRADFSVQLTEREAMAYTADHILEGWRPAGL